MIQEVPRDVDEDHAPLFPEQVEGAEGDEAVARTNVEQGLALGQAGVLEHAVAPPAVMLQGRFVLARVPGAPPVEEPLRPPVPDRPGHRPTTLRVAAILG